MKYKIKINQFNAMTHFNPTETGLNMVHFAILDFAQHWLNQKESTKKNDDGKVWIWLKHTLISQQLPITGIVERSGVYRYIKKLCDCGLLLAHPDNQRTATAFYTLGENSHLYFGCKGVDEMQQGVDEMQQGVDEMQQGVDEMQQGGVDEMQHNENNKNIHNSSTQDSLPPSESAGADSSAGSPQSEEQESQPQAKSAASKDKEFVKSLFIEKLGELKKITIAGLPPKKTMLEKIEAIGEDMYWQYAQKINTESAKVVKGFTATLDNWLILKNEGWDALKGLNDFWKKQHGSSYKEVEQFAKGEKLALNSIGAFLSAKSKEKGAIATLQQVSAKFFEHLPSKWRDLQWFKLNTIANDLPAIYALIKNSAAKHATQEEKPETLLKDEHMAIIRRQANTRAINKRSSLVHKIALVEGVFPTFCRNILNEVVPENCEWSAIKNHPLAKEIFDAI